MLTECLNQRKMFKFLKLNDLTVKSKLFPAYLAFFHICFIILMAIFGKYEFDANSLRVNGLYASKYE